jgi:glycosyltransferase involved in cell wall biosynthesis
LLPKVSIITPVFNSEKFIAKTIESAIAQSYTNWEMILVDDASSDSSVDIIKLFQDTNSQIKLYQLEQNSGAAVARNKATELATGDYIAFLDADDLWKPNKLKAQIELMQTQDIEVCFSSYELMNEDGESLNKIVTALPVLNYQKLLKSNYIGNLTGIYNAKTLGKIFVTNLKKRQDWLLWLIALQRSNKPAMSINAPLAKYRVRENSISSNKLNLVKYNYWVYKKGLGFSTIKSTIKMLIFLKEHFFIKPKQTVVTNKI